MNLRKIIDTITQDAIIHLRRKESLEKFNNIGISSEFDKERIAHLFKIGIAAAVMVLIGDMILGWGTADESLSGMDRYFSRYLQVSDARIVWSAVLGLIGIPVECLCYFGVYRSIAVKSEKYAHIYRSGILGMLAFGAFVHVVCCAVFSIVSGIAAVIVMKLIGNYPLANAISTGWISLGSIWTFGGLLINLKGGKNQVHA